MDALELLQRDFINLRLGTFLHFNSATFQFSQGDTCDWEYDCENNGAPRQHPFSPSDWNPDQLDCRQWALTAKSAGCRFAALTAKHHEGFALWPTNYGAHSVKYGGCTADVVRAYLSAFREAEIAAGLYFSVLDLTAGIGKRSCTDAQKELVLGQITELLTNYGEIPFLIVDGWNAPWGGPGESLLSFREVDALVKSLQPGCLLMNIGCTKGLQGTDIPFFENAAGQAVPAQFCGPGVICNKLTPTWFWRQTDPDTASASAQWVWEQLRQSFPRNCAYMLNLSPNPHGRIDQNLAERFAEIGQVWTMPEPITELPNGWMKRQDGKTGLAI